MRLGIVTPIVTRLPGAHARWEDGAGVPELAAIAQAADRLGYHHLTCSEHVAVPTDAARVRGGTYWDPLATFGYLAACTDRIRLATNILVLGYHHPLEIAKRYGTLDVVSNGRLVLGVGVGSLREEFDLLGAAFDDRGERGDDALRALRASLSTETPSYAGTHHRYGDVVVSPCAVQTHVPIWVGGRTGPSLRRAIALADGWAPFALSPAEVSAMLATVDVPLGFEVAVSPPPALDPAASPGQVADALAILADAGVTIGRVNVVHRSLAHYLEQLDALQTLATVGSGS